MDSNDTKVQHRADRRQIWEYKTVKCSRQQFRRLDQEDGERHWVGGAGSPVEEEAQTRKLVDPKLWDKIPRDSTYYTFHLAWSEGHNYWTYAEGLLNELGGLGWEVVAATPPWSSSGGTYGGDYSHVFHIILKRPRA